jgi:tetratricopeptide (TPR) repeat protein
MTAEEKLRRPQVKPIILSPWLAVLGGVALFGLTLNHWVTLRNLPLVAQITGWDWHPLPLLWRPEPSRPLYFVLTFPVRILPVAWQPLALNLLSAVWAALTVGVLARSVRLLPQDRTREQRQREQGEYSLLSVRAAFLPALFAVLMLAGQINFWQDAVAASNDMLDVLVFAFVILCLLEYRISQNDKWLSVMAFVYGLGITNNWALIGFFPLFLLALIWIKGFGFFHARFVARMVVCGAAGLLLYLVIPLAGSLGGDREDFAALLLSEWRAQSYGLHIIPHWVVMVAAMPTILPLIFAGVRWPSFEGEVSALGNVLTRLMLRVLHVAFLLVALVTFFDFRYSPGPRMREMPIGFLTFYYLGALAVGYFSGYALLLFGKKPAYGWERPSAVKKMFNTLMLGLVWALAVAAPVWLYIEDFPRIQAGNSPALAQFTDETLAGLPAKGAIVLSDDPARLFLLEAAYHRRGLSDDNILIETGSFSHREYLQYLASRYPDLKKIMTAPEKLHRVLPPESLVYFLFQVGKQQPIYYLHPSFGYYFEAFYMKPHGVVYELKSFPNTVAQPPLPSQTEIAANEAFWTRLEKGPLQALPDLARKDSTAQALAVDYAAALDYWGVDLQRANRLREANTNFAESLRLNPDNFIAKINLEYNNQLQRGDHRPIDSTEILYKALSFYRSVVPVLKLNGPMDEPGLDLEIGQALAQGRNFRQATALFERRLELLPGDAQAELALAKTDVDAGRGQQALEMLRGIPKGSKITPWEMARVEALAHVDNKEYSLAEKIFTDAIRADPKDPSRFSILAEFYRVRAYAALQQNKAADAAQFFNNALTNLNLDLELLRAPNAPESAADDMLEALLKKAEVQMMLRSYDGSIATLDQFLQLRPSNPTALLNHAVAEAQLRKFQEAKNDYKALRKLLPRETYVSDYGLADIAAAEGDKAEEIRRLRRYLQAAPDDTAEYVHVKQRLQKLEGR